MTVSRILALCVVLLACLTAGMFLQAQPADQKPAAQPPAGRYQFIGSPKDVGDNLLLDTATGRVYKLHRFGEERSWKPHMPPVSQ
jgi:hypothetical protein